MTNEISVGARIMLLRTERGFSRETMAELTGISAKFLYETLNNFFYLYISFYKSYKSLFYAVCRTLFYRKFYVSSYNWHIISRMKVVKKVVNSVFYPLHVFIAALADSAEPCA